MLSAFGTCRSGETYRAGRLSAQYAFTSLARANGRGDRQPHYRATQIRHRNRNRSRAETLNPTSSSIALDEIDSSSPFITERRMKAVEAPGRTSAVTSDNFRDEIESSLSYSVACAVRLSRAIATFNASPKLRVSGSVLRND